MEVPEQFRAGWWLVDSSGYTHVWIERRRLESVDLSAVVGLTSDATRARFWNIDPQNVFAGVAVGCLALHSVRAGLEHAVDDSLDPAW